MRATTAIVGLILTVGLCLAVGFLGSRFGPGAWYASLRKPPLTPPNWVFPVVWTLLYVLMGVAAWWVWLKAPWHLAWPALAMFAAQLLLNGLWSWIFFGQQRIGWAMLDLVALWAAILATTLLFWKHTMAAGAMMLPYLAWVSFAGLLNAWLWALNR